MENIIIHDAYHSIEVKPLYRIRCSDRYPKIGYVYEFEPIKAKVIEDSFDAKEVHYSNIVSPVIPRGTEIMVGKWWRNFYGTYFRVLYKEHEYDVPSEKIVIL